MLGPITLVCEFNQQTNQEINVTRSIATRLFVLVMLAAVSSAIDAAEMLQIEFGAPFADNAVLQRQMKVPVWGWSVTVHRLGNNDGVAFSEKWAVTALVK